MELFDTSSQYDFKDVLFKPKSTTLNSRKEVNLECEYAFSNGTSWKGVPIMAANMYTTGTFEVHKELAKYKLLTTMHKFYTLEDYKTQNDSNNIDYEYCIVSCGIRNKDYDNVCQILDEIRERKLSNRTILHSFDWELLKECHRLAPEIPRSFLSQLPDNCDETSDLASEDITPDFSSFKTSIPKAIANQEGQMWCPYFKDVTSELVEEAHSLGLLVCTWTVNETEDMENMIDAGVDGIITDYPNRAQKVLEIRGFNG